MSIKKVAESVLPINEAPAITKTKKELAQEKLLQLIKEETRMVKGMFQCFETPGATIKIDIRKFPEKQPYGVPAFSKTMTDGYTYEVPLYVARHLNGIDATAGACSDHPNPNIGTCSYPVHGFLWQQGQPMPNAGQDVKGVPVPLIGIAKRVKRFGFQSMEFAGA